MQSCDTSGTDQVLEIEGNLNLDDILKEYEKLSEKIDKILLANKKYINKIKK